MSRRPHLACSVAFVLVSFASSALAIQRPAPIPCRQIGGTVANRTLTLAQSPYCVIADVSFTNVRIDPGVVIRIDGDFTIDVRAGLDARGTPDEPIRFTSWTQDWNGIRFVNSSPDCVMEHCIVEKADQPGITVVDSLPSITNCTIQNNRATISGGGVRIEVSTGHLSLKGCTIRDNRSTAHGGGMYINMSNGFACVLKGCVVQDNVVNENFACGSYVGGGIYFAPSDGTLVASGCEFSGNSTNSSAFFNCFGTVALGGALYTYGGDVELSNCVFEHNWARGADDNFFGDGRGRGAGVYFAGTSDNVLNIRNSVFACNSSLTPTTNEASGSSVYLEAGTATMVNCTFARNGVVWPESPTLYNYGGTATLRNCILYWNNPSGACSGAVSYDEQIGGPGITTVTFSDVQGGYPGTGNIDVDPVFTDSGSPSCDPNVKPDCGSLDLSLVFPGSPCVDAGNPGPMNRDVCFGPSRGGDRNDMGFTGGPQGCPDSSPALVTCRSAGLNESTYTATKFIIGQTWCGTVACPTTGQPIFVLEFYDAPLHLPLPDGYVVLCDIGRPRLFALGPAPCGTTPVCIAVPLDASLIGCTLYSQAAHVGSPTFALSNAKDFVVGTY